MSMLKEFREFAVKGNVVDMAVGIIIGGAFGTIVKSLVDDVVMPPIGLGLGGLDFSQLHIVLKAGKDGATEFANLAAAKEAGAVTLNWGNFVNNVLTFLIVAFSVFMLVKSLNAAKKKFAPEEEPEPDTKDCPECFMSIPVKATRCGHCTSQLEA
ncbi:MAG: large-conductance mechanosensitive channel protein MscL [Polyangiaceae bacterium]